MASQGPLSATQGRAYGSGASWSNASNVTASDNSYATVSSGFSPGPSAYLAGYTFGAEVPDGATIDGLLVEVEAKTSSPFGDDRRISAVRLSGNGTLIGTEKTDITALASTDVYYAFGGSADVWGATLTPAMVNASTFEVACILESTGSIQTLSVDHMRVTVYYTESNTAPTVSSAPTVSYGSLTRLGPNNSPATVSFTATDSDGDALTYEIRTAASGGGTLVGSGTATSGVSKQHDIANGASGLVDGTQTLYLRVHDGTDYSADSAFTLLRDTGAPTVGTITTIPNPVVN